MVQQNTVLNLPKYKYIYNVLNDTVPYRTIPCSTIPKYFFFLDTYITGIAEHFGLLQAERDCVTGL